MQDTIEHVTRALRADATLSKLGITLEQLAPLADLKQALQKIAPVAGLLVPKFTMKEDTFIEDRTGLEFTNAVARVKNFDDAEAKARECRIGGFNDWRVPEDVELQILVNRKFHEPATHPELKAITPHSDYYITRTPTSWSTSCVWFVNFGFGGVGNGLRSLSGLCRFVRGGAAGPGQ